MERATAHSEQRMRPGPSFGAEENWLLGGALAASLALFAMAYVLFSSSDMSRMFDSGIRPRAMSDTSRVFDVDSELATLLLNEPVETIDLAVGADIPPAEAFRAAKGPPLNLLAQVEPPKPRKLRAPIALAAAAIDPPPAGPVLTDDERLIVAANTDRRELRVALMRLQERAAGGEAGVATAMLVQPLLRRAEVAAENLDGYGDALLLSEGEATKQMAFLGFYASRAAVLRDIEQAEAILG